MSFCQTAESKKNTDNNRNMSVEKSSVTRILILAIFKIEAMEVMSFYKVAKGFRLKGGETRITNLTV